uniref:Uncharacterized protein n=1 Tax=Heterorhabditis bacteriophora TaxID=37862 RepID=A0A1I7WXI5_HETBA
MSDQIAQNDTKHQKQGIDHYPFEVGASTSVDSDGVAKVRIARGVRIILFFALNRYTWFLFFKISIRGSGMNSHKEADESNPGGSVLVLDDSEKNLPSVPCYRELTEMGHHDRSVSEETLTEGMADPTERKLITKRQRTPSIQPLT